ncbi:MAG: heavy metal-associated domain-containing protein [Gammaproteobacteria bacterium]
MGCAAAARVVLERVPGVDSADVSFDTGKAVVAFDPALTSPDELIAELERMTGFGAVVVTAEMPGTQTESFNGGKSPKTPASGHRAEPEDKS